MQIEIPCKNDNCESCPFRMNDADICIINFTYNCAIDDVIGNVLKKVGKDGLLTVSHLDWILEQMRAHKED